MLICGFKQKEDRAIFDILTSVSGIGTKVGMVLLDEFSGSELINAVLEGDYKLISRAKGVGPKLAQKIILELKEKIIDALNLEDITPEELDASAPLFGDGGIGLDSIDALE